MFGIKLSFNIKKVDRAFELRERTLIHWYAWWHKSASEFFVKKDKEIDFVATKQNDKIYVQVTQEIKSEKTQKIEYDQLLEIRDNYPKYVVMANDFAGGNYEGIKTMNIIDFLLSKDY